MPARKDGEKSARDVSVRKSRGTAVVVAHKALYPPDVLFGTAFAFLDRGYLHLDVVDDERTSVEIRPKAGADLDTLVGEFKNELVTQAVRLRLARETAELRTAIVGRAIGAALPREPRPQSEERVEPELPPEIAKILAEEEDSLDFLDDPLGIAVPWEEKYGKQAPEATTSQAVPEGEPGGGGDAEG